MEQVFFDIYQKAKKDEISKEEALFILKAEDKYIPLIVYLASKLKDEFFDSTKFEFCSIINAKSGACSEDCKFCAQSKFYKTPINIYKLVDKEELVEGALRGVEFGANRYCMVLSARAASDEEVEKLCEAVREIKAQNIPINVCVSAGTIGLESLLKLKEAGVTRINHNLETSENYFPNIVSTHTWRERLETIKNVQKAGLSTCSGAIFGLGETDEDRVDLAFVYKELGVDSIPLNFLMPIPNTPLENNKPLRALDALKIIAMFRFTNKSAELRLCGGREQTLGDFHGMAAFMTNALMAGGYLTRAGRDIKKDYKMLEDMNLERLTSEEVCK
jgi:biotin synthetase